MRHKGYANLLPGEETLVKAPLQRIQLSIEQSGAVLTEAQVMSGCLLLCNLIGTASGNNSKAIFWNENDMPALKKVVVCNQVCPSLAVLIFYNTFFYSMAYSISTQCPCIILFLIFNLIGVIKLKPLDECVQISNDTLCLSISQSINTFDKI